jgi:hypothetical protein
MEDGGFAKMVGLFGEFGVGCLMVMGRMRDGKAVRRARRLSRLWRPIM